MTASGALPANIFCARDYETLAKERLDAAVWAHLMGGAGDDRAVRANREAFDNVTVVPRILRDVTAGSTACRLAGRDWAHPIFLAPLAFQRLFHPGAEVETARAADAMETGLTVSTLSSVPLEDLARGAVTERWFQLYAQPSREVTLDLVRRAEVAGYGAIVFTVDASVKPAGLSAQRAGFRGNERAANLEGYHQPTPPQGESRVFQGVMRAAPTWADVEWLRSRTSLPLWIKGVLHPDDAVAAMNAGANGLVVSNHGGRTFESAPSAMTMLPKVRAAVGEEVPLIVDGGVRSGEDVFKAIAVGADAVMVGRLQACALAVAGALGVAHMLRLLREELEVAMATVGCAAIHEIRPGKKA